MAGRGPVFPNVATVQNVYGSPYGDEHALTGQPRPRCVESHRMRRGGSALYCSPMPVDVDHRSIRLRSEGRIGAAAGQQSTAIGEDDGLGSVMHVDFGQHPFDVGFCG